MGGERQVLDGHAKEPGEPKCLHAGVLRFEGAAVDFGTNIDAKRSLNGDGLVRLNGAKTCGQPSTEDPLGRRSPSRSAVASRFSAPGAPPRRSLAMRPSPSPTWLRDRCLLTGRAGTPKRGE